MMEIEDEYAIEISEKIAGTLQPSVMFVSVWNLLLLLEKTKK
ncbi:hypothetical protein [Bacillus sp. X1(2014)]|nr:hypothetical protein [Bacillus sp. X1(2014)]